MPQCKKCKAEIKFIKTPAGRQMPVDVKLIRLVTLQGGTAEGFMPHWATCPDADHFRKGEKQELIDEKIRDDARYPD